jgi:hypothetical protein
MTTITLLSEVPMSISLLWFKGQIIKLYFRSKKFIKGERIGGPTSVLNNLIAGLIKIQQPYKLNPASHHVTPYVGVLSNTDALKWAIHAKKQGKIKYLVAGPNLVVTPLEEDGILCAPEIDLVVTPSWWVSEMYLSMAPMLEGKLVEWPVGVDTEFWSPDPMISRQDRKDWLIYDKTQQGGSIEKSRVVEILTKRRESFRTIVYGEYTREEYRKKLQNAKAMIILSPSESQGIAMFEAWACDTPTMVWDRQIVEWKGKVLHAPSGTSAPYLTNKCGYVFQGIDDFDHILTKFEASLHSFQPQDYILSNFTLDQTAEAYTHFFIKSNNKE